MYLFRKLVILSQHL